MTLWDNETPRSIAKKFSVDVNALVDLNVGALAGIKKSSKLYRGTKVTLPEDRVQQVAQQPLPDRPLSTRAGRLYVRFGKKKDGALGALGQDAIALQHEVETTFHHNKHLKNRFSCDGGGTPVAFVFFADAAEQQLVGAVALYGKDVRTMLVCEAKRRSGYGSEIIHYLSQYAREQRKPMLQLLCKPKHSGANAPEYFYEKQGFVRAKSQDAGLLDLNQARPAHDRRVKMQLAIV